MGASSQPKTVWSMCSPVKNLFAWAGFRSLASERKRVDSETVAAAAAATHYGGSLATVVIATVVSRPLQC